MTNIHELKLHPAYWILHKKFWIEELNTLDKVIAEQVIKFPHGEESKNLNRLVNRRIKEDLLTQV